MKEGKETTLLHFLNATTFNFYDIFPKELFYLLHGISAVEKAFSFVEIIYLFCLIFSYFATIYSEVYKWISDDL